MDVVPWRLILAVVLGGLVIVAAYWAWTCYRRRRRVAAMWAAPGVQQNADHTALLKEGVPTQHVVQDNEYGGSLWSQLPNEIVLEALTFTCLGGPHRAHLLACVCQRWRRLVLSMYHLQIQSVDRTASMPHSPTVHSPFAIPPVPTDRWVASSASRLLAIQSARHCRICLAHDAVETNQPRMLAWALAGAAASPFDAISLWVLCVRNGSTECVDVLAGRPDTRPLCALKEGPPCCDGDRPDHAPGSHLHGTFLKRTCARATLVLNAACAPDCTMFSKLIGIKLCHPARWVPQVMTHAIVQGRTDVADVLSQHDLLAYAIGTDKRGRLGGDPSRPTGRWLAVAARSGSVASVQWLARQPWIDSSDINKCLVDAVDAGSCNVIRWLCENGHVAHYLEALERAEVNTRFCGHVDSVLLSYAGKWNAFCVANGSLPSEQIRALLERLDAAHYRNLARFV